MMEKRAAIASSPFQIVGRSDYFFASSGSGFHVALRPALVMWEGRALIVLAVAFRLLAGSSNFFMVSSRISALV